MSKPTTNKFEMHYYLNDGSHSMDAIVRNRCEAATLNIAYEILSELDIDASILAEALEEGGVKQIWEFLGDNAKQITSVSLIIGTLLAVLTTIPSQATKELQQLDIETKKIELQKLKQDLEGDDINAAVEKAIKIIEHNPKIRVNRSNLYKHLNQYNKVTQIGISKVPHTERIVTRSNFKSFVLLSNELESIIDEKATIEITAPVLTEGKTNWKGKYNDETISFSMLDKDFKADVVAQRIGFKNGDVIECILEIAQKINEAGEIVISGHKVNIVLAHASSGSLSKETPQGIKYKYDQEQAKGQGNLFIVDSD